MAKHKDIEDGAIVRARWWATYDAAVSGMLANTVSPKMTLTAIHNRAATLAGLAHGAVVEPFTPVTPAPETP